MAGVRSEDGKKWINAFVALVSILLGFISIRFLQQLGEWWDLEASVGYFLALTQVAGVVIGVATFFAILKNKSGSGLLREVYDELVKVVWPDKDIVLKVTVGIIIGVAFVSGIFVFIDFTFQKLLELVY